MGKKDQTQWKSSEELAERKNDGETIGKDEDHHQNEKPLPEQNESAEFKEEAQHSSSFLPPPPSTFTFSSFQEFNHGFLMENSLLDRREVRQE